MFMQVLHQPEEDHSMQDFSKELNIYIRYKL